MKICIPLILIALLTSATPRDSKCGRITLKVTDGFKNGAMAIALFNSPDGFPYNFNKAYQWKNIGLSEQEGELSFDNVPYGTYAVVVKWDEFYIRPDTSFVAYNHMQGTAMSGKNNGKFKECAIKVNKKVTTVHVRMLSW